MGEPFFSVIVVSLNAGGLIGLTVSSALSQTCDDYEIIVKDGKSTDDTLNNIPEDGRIKLFSEPDSSLYDAMNQAISYSSGKYLIFMNCGDTFASDKVLEDVRLAVKDGDYGMIYGDYTRDGVVKKQPETLTRFNMYRTILCHQSVFFNGKILRAQKKYDTRYKILADYDLEQDMAKTSSHIHVDTVGDIVKFHDADQLASHIVNGDVAQVLTLQGHHCGGRVRIDLESFFAILDD